MAPGPRPGSRAAAGPLPPARPAPGAAAPDAAVTSEPASRDALGTAASTRRSRGQARRSQPGTERRTGQAAEPAPAAQRRDQRRDRRDRTRTLRDSTASGIQIGSSTDAADDRGRRSHAVSAWLGQVLGGGLVTALHPAGDRLGMPVAHGDQRHLLLAARQHVHAHRRRQTRHLLNEPMPASDLEGDQADVPERARRASSGCSIRPTCRT